MPLAAAAFAVPVLFFALHRIATTSVNLPDTVRRIASSPRDGAVLVVPTSNRGLALAWQTVHEKPVVDPIPVGAEVAEERRIETAPALASFLAREDLAPGALEVDLDLGGIEHVLLVGEDPVRERVLDRMDLWERAESPGGGAAGASWWYRIGEPVGIAPRTR